MHGRAFYDAVGDALTGFLPPSLRDFEWYRTSHNLKLWWGSDREHYETQILKKDRKIVLEIGFHAEHKDPDANDSAIAKLVSKEKMWRKTLGAEPEVGSFIGAQRSWRRISELWDATDDPELAIDAAERLASYITALEPLRKS